jgi:hypothetical protein
VVLKAYFVGLSNKMVFKAAKPLLAFPHGEGGIFACKNDG